MNKRFRYFTLAMTCLVALAAPCRGEVRIKDITQVEGARPNYLTGLGLVVGLKGTGARTQSSQQMAIEMLKRLEAPAKLARQNLLDNVYKSGNIATVIVTVKLPAFARKGSELDANVAVFDDATSLEGGTLIMTPLRGADGQVYVIAQGPLTIGGFQVRSNVAGGQQNHPTAARAVNGAIVEKEALGKIDLGGVVRLLLRDADFTTAKSVMMAINQVYPFAAKSLDSGTIQVRIPPQRRLDLPDFVGELGQLKIIPDTLARVVINERTGTVIVGSQVRISSVAIAHGNLVIKPNVSLVIPNSPADGSVPSRLGPPPNEGDDPVDDVLNALKPRPLPGDTAVDKPLSLHNVEQTFTVADLARILNALGVSPRDLIAIFQALKESGALHADLVFI